MFGWSLHSDRSGERIPPPHNTGFHRSPVAAVNVISSLASFLGPRLTGILTDAIGDFKLALLVAAGFLILTVIGTIAVNSQQRLGFGTATSRPNAERIIPACQRSEISMTRTDGHHLSSRYLQDERLAASINLACRHRLSVGSLRGSRINTSCQRSGTGRGLC